MLGLHATNPISAVLNETTTDWRGEASKCAVLFDIPRSPVVVAGTGPLLYNLLKEVSRLKEDLYQITCQAPRFRVALCHGEH